MLMTERRTKFVRERGRRASPSESVDGRLMAPLGDVRGEFGGLVETDFGKTSGQTLGRRTGCARGLGFRLRPGLLKFEPERGREPSLGIQPDAGENVVSHEVHQRPSITSGWISSVTDSDTHVIEGSG